jgi:hypothetical protein
VSHASAKQLPSDRVVFIATPFSFRIVLRPALPDEPKT